MSKEMQRKLDNADVSIMRQDKELTLSKETAKSAIRGLNNQLPYLDMESWIYISVTVTLYMICAVAGLFVDDLGKVFSMNYYFKMKKKEI